MKKLEDSSEDEAIAELRRASGFLLIVMHPDNPADSRSVKLRLLGNLSRADAIGVLRKALKAFTD